MSKKDQYHEDKYRSLVQMSQDELQKCRKECESRIKTLGDGFKRDMSIVDQEVTS